MYILSLELHLKFFFFNFYTGEQVLRATDTTEVNGNHAKIAETNLSVAHPRQDSNGAIRPNDIKPSPKPEKIPNRKSTKRDKVQMANLKTAAMLFVVTVVFIITYLPAFLMTNDMVP